MEPFSLSIYHDFKNWASAKNKNKEFVLSKNKENSRLSSLQMKAKKRHMKFIWIIAT